jgi:serine/threonine-protein kinase
VTVSDPAEAVAPGTVVGGYVIDRPIGEGGMGIVYGAVHPVIGKRAAIKVLNTRFCADHEALRRFVHEAQAVNTIGHANIVDIFSIGDLGDGRSYLVMEWLQGETLMDRLAREPLPIADVVAILVALTRALEAAHNAGVVHRDLKPENVFLVREDEGFRTKLLDFGIAKLETRRTHPRKTATGMTVGTPLFMSPEQAKGSEIDGKSDVYSLGVLAYAMVCRRTPFEHEPSSVEVLHAHISQPPRPPRELVSDVPAELDALILHMLAKAPGERPTMAEIRRRLRSLDHGGFETFTAETRAPLAKVPEPRSPLPLVVGARQAVFR